MKKKTDHDLKIIKHFFVFRKLSVKRASNPFSFDSLNRAVTSGLYDASYGPISYSENCETCLQYSRTCTGHSGHIELPLPVYNPLFIRVKLQIFTKCSFSLCNYVYNYHHSVIFSFLFWSFYPFFKSHFGQTKDTKFWTKEYCILTFCFDILYIYLIFLMLHFLQKYFEIFLYISVKKIINFN